MNSFLIFLFCFPCSSFITSHTLHSSFCTVFWGLVLACTSADFTLHTHVFPTFE